MSTILGGSGGGLFFINKSTSGENTQYLRSDDCQICANGYMNTLIDMNIQIMHLDNTFVFQVLICYGFGFCKDPF